MAANQKTILVVGATGNQGGAVVNALLEKGSSYRIRGLTRDPKSDKAKQLADQGVELVQGDLDDKNSLSEAVKGVDGVFSVTDFWFYGYDRQVQQGKNIADAAAEEGVDHFVFSGVGSHDENTGIPHFDSAWEIDQYIQSLDLPNTILKPVFFLHNFEAFLDYIKGGTLAFALKEDVSLQMVDVDDFGQITERVFASPETYIGRDMDVAGDEKTLSEMAETFTNVMGIEVQPYHMSIDDARSQFGEESALMLDWFNKVGYSTDISALEEEFGFTFTTLEAYLRKHNWDDPANKQPDQLSAWARSLGG